MALSKQRMYRFPWSWNDNPIGWLEITDKCNIYCRGCYRINGMEGHKSLEQIKDEIDLLQKWRNCDNISIAGGEPLIHPQILDVVAYIRERGMKPLILTNGLKLMDNRAMIEDLKQAGLLGFTFHIDSQQKRPDWKDKGEAELNELRLHYARLVAEVGGLFVSFGMTVYPSNLDSVPGVVRWANEHIDLVHGLVFITFRAAPMDGTYNYFVNGQRIETTRLTYTADNDQEIHITSADVYAKIKDAHPHYEASAYLGGTQTHERATWVTAVQIGSKAKMYGSLGPRMMELVQTFYHLRHGSYLVYQRSHKLTRFVWLLAAVDSGIRRAHMTFWRDAILHPRRLFQPLYVQSIGIVQGPDLLEDGRLDMCESCPDMTVWNGKLVHSCRLDEWRLYGGYVEASRNPMKVAEKTTEPV